MFDTGRADGPPVYTGMPPGALCFFIVIPHCRTTRGAMGFVILFIAILRDN